MKSILNQEIRNSLPGVVKEAVKDISTNTNFTKPWADLFKKTHEELKSETNNVLQESITKALTESKHEIIESVQMKYDCDMFEKEKRSRNIVIAHCPESEAENASERLRYDIEFVKSVTGISDNEIRKCIRAGPKEDKVTGTKKSPRPIIVTVQSPELAKSLHKYGNGNKVIYGSKIWWVNPDLTISERQANFNAREYKRLRQQNQD